METFKTNVFHTFPIFQDTKLKYSPNLQKDVGKEENKPAVKKAIGFFDSHYKQIYGPDWPAMRLALFSKPKFAALVNGFSSKDEVMSELKSLGCSNIKDIYYQGNLTTIEHWLMSMNVV